MDNGLDNRFHLWCKIRCQTMSTDVSGVAESKSPALRKKTTEIRRYLQRHLSKGLNKDRENLRIKLIEEMEAASCNNRRPLKLIQGTGRRRTSASESVCDRNGNPIRGIQRKLGRWAEHPNEQFSWSRANQGSAVSTTKNHSV